MDVWLGLPYRGVCMCVSVCKHTHIERQREYECALKSENSVIFLSCIRTSIPFYNILRASICFFFFPHSFICWWKQQFLKKMDKWQKKK